MQSCSKRKYRSIYVLHGDEPKIHVREKGEGKFVCLLIHGFGEGGYIWDEFANYLVTWCRVISIDLRGHGNSGWHNAGNYTIEAHVSDVMHVIEMLCLDKIVLVGHSLGGNVAIRIADKIKRRVVALVVVDCGLGENGDVWSVVRAQLKDQMRPYKSIDDYVAWLASRRPLPAIDMLSSLAESALRQRADFEFELRYDPALGDMDDPNSEEDDLMLRAVLKRIACPVLIVRGAGSAVLSRNTADEMMQLLHCGQMAVVPMAGHSVMIDNPNGFVASVLPFLAIIAERECAHAAAATRGTARARKRS